MEHSKKYDLTRGGIINRLLLVAIPIIGAQLMRMSYNLVDMFLLGRVGSEAVAASGVAGMYLWLAEGFLLIGKVGAEIGVSQSLGKRDESGAKDFAYNAVFLALAFGITYGAVAVIFSEPMIGFFRIQEPGVTADARRYLAIVGMASPAFFVSAVIAGIFTGAGNSRAPFMINALGVALNIVLDLIFIFGLNMGVAGAAIATSISQTIVCAASIMALLLKHDRPFESFSFSKRPNLSVIKTIMRWTVPLAVVSLLFTFFTMFVSRIVAAFGAGAIAVYRAGSQIESISWLTGEGMSTSVAAFVGQNYGARKIDRIRDGARIAMKAWFSFGVAVSVILIVAGRQLFFFFVPDPAIVDMGASFLRILALCQVFGCLEAISFGSLRGLGRTIPQFVVSIGCNSVRIPIAYALSNVIGVDGVWIGIALTASLRGLFAYLWFRREMKYLQ